MTFACKGRGFCPRCGGRRMAAWLFRQGLGAEDEGDGDEDDDAQAVIQQASLLGQAALGERAGKRARRVQVLGGRSSHFRRAARASPGTACTP